MKTTALVLAVCFMLAVSTNANAHTDTSDMVQTEEACELNAAQGGDGLCQAKPLTFKHEILSAGDGVSHPKAGQQITVHYTGSLTDGSVFDSSHNRKQPFVFTVGVGQVIKCWDQGILLMTKGEKARLTCPHDYAYGERGYPPIIPERATLFFEVELLSIGN